MWRYVCLSIGMAGTWGVPRLAAIEYTLVDLGTLGGSRAIANAVSDSGLVSGGARDGGSTWHAFRWNAMDGLVELGINASPSWSYGINDAGHVTGYYVQPDSSLQAFRWTSGGGLIDLPDLGGGHSAVFEVSNDGTIAGDSKLPTGESHAVFWDSQNAIHDLGTLPNSVGSTAVAVNATGAIAGTANMSDGYQHAFVWDAENGMQDLGTLGSADSLGLGINNLGWVVGDSQAPSTDYEAFLWKPGAGMAELVIPSNGPVIAYDINDAGTVTGYVSGSLTRAFAWSEADGVTFLEAFGGTTRARSINENGWIVGEAWGAPDGYAHAVMWVPVPEPTTLCLLVVGLLGASWGRRTESSCISRRRG